jgi:hypothetical protein
MGGRAGPADKLKIIHMKLAIVSSVGGYTWAGSEEMWKLLAVELLRSGHEVAVWANTQIAS